MAGGPSTNTVVHGDVRVVFDGGMVGDFEIIDDELQELQGMNSDEE